jgi:nucleoside-diphosphate-sugar epimerase
MKILVGNTGLIGTTLTETMKFDLMFNSKNINNFNKLVDEDGYELYLSCLPATKWMVNKNLPSDLDNIQNIINILRKQKYSKIVLFSTIDVYNDSPLDVNEDYKPNFGNLSYGNNRYLFELMVKEYLEFDDLKVFRLPALFNRHIKKNVLFDLINNNNVDQINSNSMFQWYNLDNLHNDIIKYSSEFPNETTFNLFTEPIETIDIISLFGNAKNLVKHNNIKISYDYTTKYNNSGYINTKDKVLIEIKKFIDEVSGK